jgi:hypothetical protein
MAALATPKVVTRGLGTDSAFHCSLEGEVIVNPEDWLQVECP